MKYGELNLGIVNKTEHIINCDAAPFVLDTWEVEEHKKSGQLVFYPTKIKLHLSPNQIGRMGIVEGNKLRIELANEPVLNANVLDYLLVHPELIPEDWKCDEKGNSRYIFSRHIFFWGTIYRDSGGSLIVRCLLFNNGGWCWDFQYVDNIWSCRDYAALRASI